MQCESRGCVREGEDEYGMCWVHRRGQAQGLREASEALHRAHEAARFKTGPAKKSKRRKVKS